MNYVRASKENKNLDALIFLASPALVDAAAKRMLSVDTSGTVISDRLDKKVYTMIRKQNRVWKVDSISLPVRRVVATIMILCTIAFSACMSVQAVREEVWNVILEWYDRFVAVFYVTSVTPPKTIEDFREPTLQPANTEKQIVVQSDTLYQIHFTGSNNIVLIYQQTLLTEQSVDFDSENGCVHLPTVVHGYKGHLFTYDDGVKVITWHDTKFAYTLYSYSDTIDADALLRIAESVK